MAPTATQPMPYILKRTLELLCKLVPARFRTDIPVVPVVRLSGVIGVVTPLRPGLMLSSTARSLERAFSIRNARAVALIVNSPGGSPAQSHLIFRRIRQLAAEKKLPVIAFVEDVGASFGFPKLMEKLGVERRLYTAGERKVMLDPFLPEKPEDLKRIKAIQKDIHEHFIALVRERRGSKLKGNEKTLFSGEFWTAQMAVELGLADRIGDLRATLRERYGEKVRTPLISEGRGLFGRRIPGLGSLEALMRQPGLAADLLSALETRALWSRYGL